MSKKVSFNKSNQQVLSVLKWSTFFDSSNKLIFIIQTPKNEVKLNLSSILNKFLLKSYKNKSSIYIKNEKEVKLFNLKTVDKNTCFAAIIPGNNICHTLDKIEYIILNYRHTVGKSMHALFNVYLQWKKHIAEKIEAQDFVLTSFEELNLGRDIAYKMKSNMGHPVKNLTKWKTFYEAIQKKESEILSEAQKCSSFSENFIERKFNFDEQFRWDLTERKKITFIPNASFSILNEIALILCDELRHSEVIVKLNYNSESNHYLYSENSIYNADAATFTNTCNWSIASGFLFDILLHSIKKTDSNNLAQNNKHQFNLEEILELWKKRKNENSIISFLRMSTFHRSPQPHITILTQHLENNLIKVMPAVPNSLLLCKTPREINKLNLPTQEQYLTLKELEKSSSFLKSQITVGGIPFVHHKGALVCDTIQFIINNPENFSNFSFLEKSYIELSETEYSAFEEKRQTPSEKKIICTHFDNQDVIERMAGCVPWRQDEPKRISQNRKCDRYENGKTLPYDIKQIEELKNISFGMRFEPSNESKLKLSIEEALQALKVFQKNYIDNQQNKDSSLQFFDSELEKLKSNLTFVAVPYFEVDGNEISESDWLEAKKLPQGYKLSNGSFLSISEYEKYLEVYYLRKKVFSRFKTLGIQDIWKNNMVSLNAVESILNPQEYLSQLGLRTGDILKTLEKDLSTSFAQHIEQNGISNLNIKMRPYQNYGVAWAYTRLKMNFGICVADEMGLGKTLQAIAILNLIPHKKKSSLIVVPKTLLINWKREFEKFSPNLKLSLYEGGEKLKKTPIIITTYSRLRLAEELFEKQDWNVLLLDEAHTIKNSETQTTQVIKKLNADYRLALTGTPIENHARELWSLIDFLNPGYLGKSKDFSAYTTYARSSDEKIKLLEPIKSVLSPIILRRTKSDPQVELNLPDKVFENMECELSPEQVTLYRAVLEVVGSELLEINNAFKRQSVFLKSLLHLKQICNHPDAFYNGTEDIIIMNEKDKNDITYIDKKVKGLIQKKLRNKFIRESKTVEELIERSGKLSALYGILSGLKNTNEGVLIFTQYRSTAHIILKMLKLSKVKNWEKTEFIDGSLTTEKRMEIVDNFQEKCVITLNQKFVEDGCPILLLSLKAGGVGLNLMKANRVIHFDRWWNPAVEAQATDRVHRFGQSRTVFVHTLTSCGTIEESIAKMHEAKKGLAHDLLGGAEAETTAELLTSENGFWNLVDPKNLFLNRKNQNYLPSASKLNKEMVL